MAGTRVKDFRLSRFELHAVYAMAPDSVTPAVSLLSPHHQLAGGQMAAHSMPVTAERFLSARENANRWGRSESIAMALAKSWLTYNLPQYVLSDEELMGAYLGGDRAAFDELYHRYARHLLHFLGKGMTREEAGIFCSKPSCISTGVAPTFARGPVRPWLFTIGINVKRQHLRTCRRRSEVPLEPSALPGAAPSDFRADDLRGRASRLGRTYARSARGHPASLDRGVQLPGDRSEGGDTVNAVKCEPTADTYSSESDWERNA